MNTLAHASETYNAAASWWMFLNTMGQMVVFLGGLIGFIGIIIFLITKKLGNDQ